ncbi:MAG: tRNA 2-thiouridine(34) synthase MnmA [Candidatus Micrarchaeota archaeon]|nr:tRNA 2-thiouridine(34) synthase MnmA [Candidatus Micrarchaeota archaeon]
MAEKIVVGMSGGVDSSVSLLILKQQGWEPVGVSLLLPAWEGECKRENACCTAQSLASAKSVCKAAGVPYYVYDCREEFRKAVMDYFVTELALGRTPNPCNFCNWHVKFTKLFEWAKMHGIKYVATGHYAKIKKKKEGWFLARPKDRIKDQTYGLCFLPREWLPNIVFPLADLTKQAVYEIAVKHGFDFYTKVKQSQDLCFVSGKYMRKFLLEKIGAKRGPIIEYETMRQIGRHDGIFNFTIGQRRGLFFPQRYFVAAVDPSKNAVFVTKDRGKLAKNGMVVKNFNYLCKPFKRISGAIQIHPHQKEVRSKIAAISKGELKVWLSSPLEGIAPGQICAVYKKDICLGGGIIDSSF